MTTLASSFTYTGFPISAPVGTIVSYLGTTDPDGWIICDGVARTGGAGRYKDLFPILNNAMGVNSNTLDSVTPPNLKNKFLYGKTNTNTTTSGVGGNETINISVNQMPTHNHTINIVDSGHTHVNTLSDTGHTHANTVSNPEHTHANTLSDPGHTHDWNYGTESDDQGQGTSNREFTAILEGNNDATAPIESAYTDMDIVNVAATTTVAIDNVAAYTGMGIVNVAAYTGISATSNDNGSGAPVNILPPYFTVNYIIKY